MGKDGGLGIEINYPQQQAGKDSKEPLSAESAYYILEKIRPQPFKIARFDTYWCMPHWLLISVLPIPPLHVRPTIVRAGGMASDDELTHQLLKIVKDNKVFQEKINSRSPEDALMKHEKNLAERINNFFNNERGSSSQEKHRKTGKVLKGI